MNYISITYTLEFRIKGFPNYQMTKCGRMFNVKTNREIRKRSNNGSIGYWIGKKFLIIPKSGSGKILERIPKHKNPF